MALVPGVPATVGGRLATACTVIENDTRDALSEPSLTRMTRIIENLVVYPENMKANLEASHGLVFSQQLLLTLIQKGLSRESAYDLVQPLAMRAWEERRSFSTLVEGNEQIRDLLTSEEIRNAFNPDNHLKHVETIFERVGLEGS